MALGKVASAEPRDRNQAPLMNPYLTADGRWFFFTGLETDRHLPAVCRALDRADLLEDPRFADARSVRKHRTEVIAVLDEIIATRTFDEWAERFEAEGVWWAPAQTPAQVVEDPQFLATGGLVDIAEGPGGPAQRSVRGPGQLLRRARRPGRAGPRPRRAHRRSPRRAQLIGRTGG